MPHKTKELIKEYRQKNKDRILAYQRKWHAEHPGKQQEYESHRNKESRDAWQKKWRTEHKDRVRACQKLSNFKRYWKARKAVVAALGGACIKCGFDNILALEVHHKNQDGGKERKSYGNGVRCNDYRYYKGLLLHLSDLELLCANCHSILSWKSKKRFPLAPVIDFEDVLILRKDPIDKQPEIV